MHRLEDGDGWKVYMPKTNTMVHTNALIANLFLIMSNPTTRLCGRRL